MSAGVGRSFNLTEGIKRRRRRSAALFGALFTSSFYALHFCVATCHEVSFITPAPSKQCLSYETFCSVYTKKKSKYLK